MTLSHFNKYKCITSQKQIKNFNLNKHMSFVGTKFNTGFLFSSTV